MKRTVFAAIIAIILSMLFCSCSSYDITIKDPSGEVIFGTQDRTDEEASGETETKRIGLIGYTEKDSPAEFEKPEEGAPPVEWADPEKKPTIYLYDNRQGGFYGISYPGITGEVSLDGLVRFTAMALNEYAYCSEEIDFSCRQKKNMAVVDVTVKGENAKRLLDDDYRCTEFLESIARTIIENHGPSTDVGFTMNGGAQFATASYELEADGWGRYIPQELYCKLSSKEFDALRAICEYPPQLVEQKLEGCFRGKEDYPFKAEGVSLPKEAHLLLYAAAETGEFREPSAIPDKTKVLAALEKLPWATTNPSYAEYGYTPYYDVAPIAQEVMDDAFYPKEWVEEFVKYLFGNEASVTHGVDFGSRYCYYANAGVYTPPHMGGVLYIYPYIIAAKETENGYEAEFFLLKEGMGGFAFNDDPWEDYEVGSDGCAAYENFWEDPRIAKFAQNPDETYIATLERNEDGRLIVTSILRG